MSKIEFDDDDVLSVEPSKSFMGSQLFKFGNLIEKVKNNWGSAMELWIGEGANCELLSPKGGGWQKGKIRIRFEFIPDEPPADTPEADSLVLGEESETELGSSTTQQQ